MALNGTQSPCPSSGSVDNCDRDNHDEKKCTDEETSNCDLENQENNLDEENNEEEEKISIDEEEPLLKKAKKYGDSSAVTPHIKKVQYQ